METINPPEPQTKLPDQLAGIVTPEKLRQNEEALLATAPEVSADALEAAKQKLSELFLIHATDSDTGFRTGIMPHARHTDPTGNFGMTFSFDESLGLDECVFFSWPLPQNDESYKDANRVLVSSDLLQDERCFVTPRDLKESALVTEDEQGNEADLDHLTDEEWLYLEGVYGEVYDGTYQDLESGSVEPFEYDGVIVPKERIDSIRATFKKQLENLYFSRVVSGKVWFEYVARCLAAGGPEDVPLGEIKFTGPVSPGSIEAIVDAGEFNETYVPHVKQTLA